MHAICIAVVSLQEFPIIHDTAGMLASSEAAAACRTGRCRPNAARNSLDARVGQWFLGEISNCTALLAGLAA